MATKTPQPIIHTFKEINKGKYKTTKHYELIDVSMGHSLLSNLLNISKNQNCAFSMPEYWLKVKQDKIWSNYITGLFKTERKNTFKGDSNRRQNLLIFKFSKGTDILTVYYFKDYFTRNIGLVQKYLPMKTKKRAVQLPL